MALPRVISFVVTTGVPPGYVNECALVQLADRVVFIGDAVAHEPPFQSDRRQKVIDRAAVEFAYRLADLIANGLTEEPA